MKLFDKIRNLLDENYNNKINIPRITILQVCLLTFFEILAACLLLQGSLMIISFVLIVVYILSLSVFYRLWRLFYSVLSFSILVILEICISLAVRILIF